MASGAMQVIGEVAAAWGVLIPYALLAVGILAWGYAPLPRELVWRSLRWSLLGGVGILFPIMWVGNAYVASLRPGHASPAWAAGLMALRLLPVYVVFAAVVVFDLRVRRWTRLGFQRRPEYVRGLAYLATAVLLVFGLILVILGFIGLAGLRMD